MSLLPFIDRDPTSHEFQRIRLLLSTYQDGTGYEAGGALPGWRDFERCVALALSSLARENKALFDVVLGRQGVPTPEYGLSCKMRGELGLFDRKDTIYIEVSNAAAQFRSHLKTKGIADETDIAANPQVTGEAILELVRLWKEKSSIENSASGGTIDLGLSSFLVLLYKLTKNKVGEYELFKVPLDVVKEGMLNWSVPSKYIKKSDTEKPLALLRGVDANKNTLAEWYFSSGGQLKFYPPASVATWRSGRFVLEPLPAGTRDGILSKVEEYFPDLWRETETRTSAP